DGRFALRTPAGNFEGLRALATASNYAKTLAKIPPVDARGLAALTILMEDPAEIRGIVIDPKNQPIEGVALTLANDPGNAVADITTSDASGAFAFAASATTAKYMIRARKVGFGVGETHVDVPGPLVEPIVLQPGGWIRIALSGALPKIPSTTNATILTRYD